MLPGRSGSTAGQRVAEGIGIGYLPLYGRLLRAETRQGFAGWWVAWDAGYASWNNADLLQIVPEQ